MRVVSSIVTWGSLLALGVVGACSVINAPGQVIDPGSGGMGGSGGGGMGGMPDVCNDGVVGMTEQCDDGNMDENDACTNDCKVQNFRITNNAAANVDEFPGVGLSGTDVMNFLVVWRQRADVAGNCAHDVVGKVLNPRGGEVKDVPKTNSATCAGKPRVATISAETAAARGTSMVVYLGNESACANGMCNIRRRLVDPNGNLVGLNDPAFGGQVIPGATIAVAAAVANSFGVVWDSPVLPVQTFFQAFTADQMVSGPSQPLGGTHATPGNPGIWSSKQGFIAAWDTDDSLMSAQEFAPNGMPLSAIFPICTSGSCKDPDGAYVGPDNQFLTVFIKDGAVHKRPFTAAEMPAQQPVPISETGMNEQNPRVVHYAGRSVVVWADTNNGQCDIYGRIIDASGNTVGGQFQVNDVEDPLAVPPPRCQTWPTLAVNAVGDVLVVWDDFDPGMGSFQVKGKLYPGLMVRPPAIFGID